ncbi:hypothetical protein Acr_00g0030960 [Actinidia rufa]|uniref:Uncharacterized protein n=1 Tax=Actinidia rufa TaxID=165716 RepID=A0A7J0DEY8_9ERIC|nr:hypothetical protein Acr_00g0030960 [Actinidia rufa]
MSRRSSLLRDRCGEDFRLLDTSVLLSPWLFSLDRATGCLSFWVLIGRAPSPLDLVLEDYILSTWTGPISRLSTKIWAICVSYACSRPIVTSRWSLPPGDNRPGLCFEVAFAALCASASSFPSLSPGVLRTWSAPGLTIAFNNCTLTTVSPATGAVFGKRLSDEGLVVLPATVSFHAQIWAENRARVLQASLCCVSSVGVPANLWV